MEAVMHVTIEHTDDSGTLLQGTARGDGASEVVKALGWRWSRALGAWFVPRSRDVAPKRPLIERTAGALREAGSVVDVQVDSTPGDRPAAEARRTERSGKRVEMLTQRSTREQATADERSAAADRITEHIPFGQPILLGHHSQAKAERTAAKVHAHRRASWEHQSKADAAAAAARTAAAGPGARHDPVTVANRVERLSAGIRLDERRLAALEASTDQVRNGCDQSLLERLAAARADLEHWQGVRAAQLADGTATDYSRETVRPGDLVKIRGRWYTVARANAKTVAVQTERTWSDKAPWHEVQDHRGASPA